MACAIEVNLEHNFSLTNMNSQYFWIFKVLSFFFPKSLNFEIFQYIQNHKKFENLIFLVDAKGKNTDKK